MNVFKCFISRGFVEFSVVNLRKNKFEMPGFFFLLEIRRKTIILDVTEKKCAKERICRLFYEEIWKKLKFEGKKHRVIGYIR